MHSDTFFTSDKPELFGGSGFNVHLVQINLKIRSNQRAHRFNMRRHFWRLSNDGVVDIADLPAFGVDQAHHMTQQHATVRTFEGRVGVREMLADIAQRRGAEQRITERMQQHVAIRMGQQTKFMWDSHTAQGNKIALSKTVHIIAVANTHKKRPD